MSEDLYQVTIEFSQAGKPRTWRGLLSDVNLSGASTVLSRFNQRGQITGLRVHKTRLAPPRADSDSLFAMLAELRAAFGE